MTATGMGLIEFLDRAGDGGQMTDSWSRALKSACKSLLTTVDPEGWESMDLAEANLDELVARFRTARPGLTQGSLYTYGRRLHNAVSAYLQYLADPDAWQARQPALSAPDGLVSYPYPLRPGLMLSLGLPPDLTSTEVTRLSAFLQSLVVDS